MGKRKTTHKCRETCSCKEIIRETCSCKESIRETCSCKESIRETCSFKESITSLQYKETGRKFYSWKQLESNPQGQDSYNNKSTNTFCERARIIKLPVPITVESVSAKETNFATKLLVEYERYTTIMESEETEALKLHFFPSMIFEHIPKHIERMAGG